MPIYKESLQLPHGDETTTVYLFNYSNYLQNLSENKPVRQLICVDSCMTLGTKNFTNLETTQFQRGLREGKEFTGYFIRTINGPYDYCFKIWTDRLLPIAPLNAKVPNENEVLKAIVIDRNEQYFGIACGPFLAYCFSELLENLGYQLEKLQLPFAGVKVKLRRADPMNRPKQIPYAAFEAIPI